MAEKFVVKAEVRETRGKNEARRMRAQGMVPVSIYGGGAENTAATVALKDLAAVLRSDSGQNTVFDLEIAGKETASVMFQDRQIDPLKGRLIHADLRRIGKGEKFEMTVPIHLIGKAAGLSEEGAVLNQPMRSIKILVEPAKTPEFIEVDVTNLGANESIHVSDLKSADYEVHEAADAVVASVSIVKASVLEAQTEGGAQPAVVGQEAPAETKGE